MTQSTSLQALIDYGSFPVFVKGEKQTALISGKTCVYFEWTYGIREHDGWLTFWNGDRTLAPLAVLTPLGLLELRIYQVRLYLEPSYRYTYSPRDANKAPEVVSEYG